MTVGPGSGNQQGTQVFDSGKTRTAHGSRGKEGHGHSSDENPEGLRQRFEAEAEPLQLLQDCQLPLIGANYELADTPGTLRQIPNPSGMQSQSSPQPFPVQRLPEPNRRGEVNPTGSQLEGKSSNGSYNRQSMPLNPTHMQQYAAYQQSQMHGEMLTQHFPTNAMQYPQMFTPNPGLLQSLQPVAPGAIPSFLTGQVAIQRFEPKPLLSLPVPQNKGIGLALSCDEEQLSEYQILVRKQLEVFEAVQEDVDSNTQGRKKQVFLGQVGIRCRHCAGFPLRQRGRGAVYYPTKLQGLFSFRNRC